MKAVFVGGGSYHLPPLLRGALAVDGVFDGGEIRLVDLDKERAGLVGRFVMKAPEFAGRDCRIRWDLDLDRALEGADVVCVILMCGSQKSHGRSMVAARDHGFLASDNLSLPGSFLGVKSAPLLLDIAAKMEKSCPRAILLDFANPAGLLGGMLNRHTRIRSLGVCAGATNHQWDLTRILDGRDELGTEIDVECAGVNHCAFIQRGKKGGEDLFALLDRKLGGEAPWSPPAFQPWMPAGSRKTITRALRWMIQIYRELGVMLFSSEGDGLYRFFHDAVVEENRRADEGKSHAERLKQFTRITPARRKELDKSFRAMVEGDLDAAFWAEHWKTDHRASRADENIFVKIFTGLAGVRPMAIHASDANGGAVANLPRGLSLEYTHRVHGKTVEPAGTYTIPPQVHGMIAALAAHQTMVGDAAATRDPRLLAQAFLAFPVQAYTRNLRKALKKLLAVNAGEIAPPLRRMKEYL